MCVCVHAGLYEHTSVGVHTHVYMYICRGQMLMLGVFFNCLLLYLLREESLDVPGALWLSFSGWLACPGDPMSPPPQCKNYR